MNDCMAYGQVSSPSQENPTSASTELDVVYVTIAIWNYVRLYRTVSWLYSLNIYTSVH